MSDPLAYFITWTCYGTWLHGDDRGSIDRSHNVYGTPCLTPDASRHRHAHERRRQPPFTMDTPARRIVTDVIEAHCRHREWELGALNVRTNHVHVVVSGPPSPDQALVEFKAWATRRLREAGLAAAGRKIWTNHGSTRYLWKQQAVDEAVKYVLDAQGEDLA